MSVSLLAVAAIVAGVMINRSRQPDSVPELEPDRGVADSVELEELRAAGF